jgi:PAS domain S-box-containing protein
MTDEDTAVPTGARLVARGHPRVWGSEALLEIALGAGHMGTWWWDRETGAGAWSDAQFRLFGYRPGEVPVGYATMLALVVPEDRARFEAVCREVFERGEVELEFRIRRHGDGAERCIFGRGRALDDRYVVGVNIDVTERKRFEARLRESEARLQLALAAGGMGVWDWDLDTDTIHWSDGTYALLGLPSQTSASLPLFFDMVLDDDRAALQAAIARARETGCYAHELRLRRADGRVVWLAAQGAVHTDENGGKRLIGATFDISTRKAAEADRERASQRKDEFLAMLAHELRNPLAAIAAAASMLPDTAADARTSAAAGIIRRQAQHLGRLVGDLVDLALIDRARIELRRESTDVLAAVRQALEQVQPAIAANRQSVALAAPAAPVHVLGDPTRLAQVFANLLGNAAKYSPPGARIDLVVAPRGSTVEIAVEDSGPGIAPEMLPHVFEAFTQGPRTLDRAEGGLGLGLAIV